MKVITFIRHIVRLWAIFFFKYWRFWNSKLLARLKCLFSESAGTKLSWASWNCGWTCPILIIISSIQPCVSIKSSYCTFYLLLSQVFQSFTQCWSPGILGWQTGERTLTLLLQKYQFWKLLFFMLKNIALEEALRSDRVRWVDLRSELRTARCP